MGLLINLVGTRIGQIVVLRRGPNLGKSTRWWCKCDCGNEVLIHSSALRKTKPTEHCGCLTGEKISKALKTHGHGNDQTGALLYSAKVRAKKLGLQFNLTMEDIIIPDFCPYLGIPITHSHGKQTANSPSLDRIDPTLGYIKGNVEIISYRANAIKHNASFEEFELMYINWRNRI